MVLASIIQYLHILGGDLFQGKPKEEASQYPTLWRPCCTLRMRTMGRVKRLVSSTAIQASWSTHYRA